LHELFPTSSWYLLVTQLLQDASPVSMNFPGEQLTQVPSDFFIFPEAHAA